jgi:dihydrofolate reductase
VRKLTYYVATTIDGYIAGPGGETDFFPLDAEMLDHIAEAYPDTLPTHMRAPYGLGDANDRFDTVVMGRRTYQPALDMGITNPYAHLCQYVVSASLGEVAPDVCVVREDPLGLVQRLKGEEGKEIWLAGGAELAGAVLPAIDELIVKTYPVIAGVGIPMFRAPFDGRAFRLVASGALASSGTVAIYTRVERTADSAPDAQEDHA